MRWVRRSHAPATGKTPCATFARRVKAQRLVELKVDWSKAKVNRDEYLAVIDGIVYGEDPRQGYFQGSRFLHPELKFQITFPAGGVNSQTISIDIRQRREIILPVTRAEC